MLSQRGWAIILFLNIAFIVSRSSLCSFASGKTKYSMRHLKLVFHLSSYSNSGRLHWQRLSSEAACAARPSTSHIRLLSSLRPQHLCCGGSLEQVHQYPQWGLCSSWTRSSCLRSLYVPPAALHDRFQQSVKRDSPDTNAGWTCRTLLELYANVHPVYCGRYRGARC